VRYNDEGKKLRRIAVCSGSGGSLLPNAAALGCDALITGDVKHDVFIDAHNQGIVVFDAGHFHTENIFCEYMQNLLSENFPDIDVAIAESGRDLLSYEV
jgi:putative NIF3 family GTP cyclohydrolase 1 type 2